MNPLTPKPASPTPVPAPASSNSYRKLNRRSKNIARVVALFVAILLFGGGIGYYIAHVSKLQTKQVSTPQVKTLSDDELNKLSTLGSNLGTSNQLLTVGANAQFNNSVIINKDISISGKLNANGPVTLKSLSVSGLDSSLGGLNVGGNLTVIGTSTLQKGATVGQLLSVNGNLTVSGTATFGSISASAISVRNITITGPLVINHITSSGPQPSSASGSAVGGGGTTSLSGNDTAGTINMNIGSGSNAGILVNVTFRAPYGANIHVLITPVSGGASSANTYVTRTANGFQIRSDSPLPAGSLLSYDYFVIQ